MTIYYDVQLPINHVISKTVLHPVTVGITSHNHAESLLNFSDLSIDKFFFLLFVMKLENNNNKFHCMAFKW